MSVTVCNVCVSMRKLRKCNTRRTQNTQWVAVAFAACPLISPALYQALALLTALLSFSLSSYCIVAV